MERWEQHKGRGVKSLLTQGKESTAQFCIRWLMPFIPQGSSLAGPEHSASFSMNPPNVPVRMLRTGISTGTTSCDVPADEVKLC